MEIAEFPYFEVQFNKESDVVDQNEPDQLLAFLEQGNAQDRTTDIFVISHGWNNDMEEARKLYRRFFTTMRAELNASDIKDRRFAVTGVLWPSKKFADKLLIAGGAAGADSLADTVLQAQIDRLKGGFDGQDGDSKLEKAKSLVQFLDSEAAQREFADLVRSLLSKQEKQVDVDGNASFFTEDGDALMDRLSRSVPTARRIDEDDSGGAAAVTVRHGEDNEGGSAGVIDFLGGVRNGALNLLNFATYYQMKERAGQVGTDGLYPLLRRIHEKLPELRIHLIGHSFGCRLVTAAAAGSAAGPAVARTMTLLQGAFSHHGFAEKFDGARDGFFRHVITGQRVSGPILITHTRNDTAVGKLYPLASMVARQDAAGVGGPSDRFGGIGSNGAQKTPEALSGELLSASEHYRFEPGGVYNLQSDRFIMDHSDICSSEVVHAIAAAVAET